MIHNNAYTLFENHPKCRIWIFGLWHFLPIFVLLKLTCLVKLCDRKLQVFKNSPKWTIFGLVDRRLSTQNGNVARFARNVEWDFFCDFQTPCTCYNCDITRTCTTLNSCQSLKCFSPLSLIYSNTFYYERHWAMIRIIDFNFQANNKLPPSIIHTWITAVVASDVSFIPNMCPYKCC